ncbi:MAG: hypothetical protein ACKOBG_01830 [Actinomycetota bacterium]
MAPALQCPDCATKHRLDDVPEAGTFGCRGCGRLLKVPGGRAVGSPAPAAPAPLPVVSPPAPEPTPVIAPPTAPEVPSVVDPPAERVLASAVAGTTGAPVAATVPPPRSEATAVLPETVDPTQTPERAKRRVAWWLVLCLWIVALPAGFLIVFLVARLTGLFTSDQLSDIFLASGFDRFWPLARLVPLVALVTALIVQIGAAAFARRSRPVPQVTTGADDGLR